MDAFGELVAGEALFEEGAEGGGEGGGGVGVGGDHVGGDGLAPGGVGFAADEGGLDAGGGGDGFFDLARVDVVGAGVDHAVEAAAEVEVAVVVEPADVAEGVPAVGVGVAGDHGVAADAELAAVRWLAGDGADAEVGAGDGPAAAAGQVGVASGDAAVVLDAQHRQGPAALEPAVELDQDRADAVVGLGDLLGGDGGAAVEEAAQRWGDGAARAVEGVGEAGHHAGDEEAGGGLVAVHGLHEGVGVEALQQDLGQAHVQEREGPDEAGAVGELLGGDEDLVAVEPGPVGCRTGTGRRCS